MFFNFAYSPDRMLVRFVSEDNSLILEAGHKWSIAPVIDELGALDFASMCAVRPNDFSSWIRVTYPIDLTEMHVFFQRLRVLKMSWEVEIRSTRDSCEMDLMASGFMDNASGFLDQLCFAQILLAAGFELENEVCQFVLRDILASPRFTFRKKGTLDSDFYPLCSRLAKLCRESGPTSFIHLKWKVPKIMAGDPAPPLSFHMLQRSDAPDYCRFLERASRHIERLSGGKVIPFDGGDIVQADYEMELNFGGERSRFLPEHLALSKEGTLAQLRRTEYYLLKEGLSGGRIVAGVGLAVFPDHSPSLWITYCATDQDSVGGLGWHIIGFILRRALSFEKRPSVYVWTGEDNTYAQGFYENVGFKLVNFPPPDIRKGGKFASFVFEYDSFVSGGTGDRVRIG